MKKKTELNKTEKELMSLKLLLICLTLKLLVMFKKKFLEMAKSQKTSDGSFEILNESQSQQVMGGCQVLKRCRRFAGTCPVLGSCGVFAEQEE